MPCWPLVLGSDSATPLPEADVRDLRSLRARNEGGSGLRPGGLAHLGPPVTALYAFDLSLATCDRACDRQAQSDGCGIFLRMVLH